MTLSATEQYLLELINRGRLAPDAEAARFGISLNSGLSAGTISSAAKQVLAPNALLEAAATKHSLWMLATNTFSHTGAGGSDPGDRISAEGYNWQRYGENIAWRGTTGTLNIQATIDSIYEGLFRSSGHRTNTLGDNFRELGLGVETGQFTSGGTTYNAMMATENFGTSGSKTFLTGVAYTDSDGDQFYSIGEGLGGVTFDVGGSGATTAAAGGYAIGLTGAKGMTVTGTVGALAFSAALDMDGGNVKLDVVDGFKFRTSGNISLGTGIQQVELLGIADLNANGNADANLLVGNNGANRLSGGQSNDNLSGRQGHDILFGGKGADIMHGGQGDDYLSGDRGYDTLWGDKGRDILSGGWGIDQLTGGADADRFLFNVGDFQDTITDFSATDGDRLQFDDALWGNVAMAASQVVSTFAHVVAGGVLFDFGQDELMLAGLTTTSGLQNYIDIV
ncbi:CAP domain-containing protein [Frigidibacter sp. RF13]|uniref:CAP domain-containing protein n=1 Tax=Frigidibacter sp. RF13 TaxID=2997340 RepID=UPI00226E2753|nr:CAP domain-containing protein [Frigidibacter sp. RF13]MCY1127639.1 CAP domain-containing protein [Frigidibacter sp. RF13]